MHSDVLDKAMLSRLQAQTALFNALFPLMGFVARADGEVNALEKTYLDQTIEGLQLNADQKKSSLQLFYFGAKKQAEADGIARQFVQQSGVNQLLVSKLFQTQLELATVDAPINSLEQSALYTIADSVGIARSAVANILPAAATEHSEQEKQRHALLPDFKLLSVEPQESLVAVKQAYRRLIAKYHPDRLISEGATQDTIQQATLRSQQIRAAYERIVVFLEAQDASADSGFDFVVEGLDDTGSLDLDLNLDDVKIDFGQKY